MTANPELTTRPKTPTRKDAFIFRGKTALLQMRRLLIDGMGPRVRRYMRSTALETAPAIATSRSELWTESGPEERFLVAGKIHNLRIAVSRLDGIVIPGGEIFSFWKQLGRAGRIGGYVEGRELREGCIIPSVGGGLCQISNALYDAALQAGFEIVERHAHSQIIPGSLAEAGRDATVFWNYIDLRFRADSAFRIEAKLDSESMVVRFRGEKQNGKLHALTRTVIHADSPNSCASCEADCHRVVPPGRQTNFGSTAFMLDEFTPELDSYVQSNRTNADRLLIPLDGGRFRKGNYAWSTEGFRSTRQSLVVTARRSFRSRRLSAQGAARQINLLEMYKELASSYAQKLGHDTLHIVVQQNLLPYLWRSGQLGGRTFDVLMTALPMSDIQRRLDAAFSLHPESKTLSDFRADEKLIAAESEALKHARKIVTPHTEIASLFADRVELLDWNIPTVLQRQPGKNEKPRIVFPASTVGRKGCYELREAVRGIDVQIVLLGPLIEASDFWRGFDTIRGGDDWLEGANAVVLPAFVEHRPRRLLLAAAAGIPVIASNACGLANLKGIETVDASDVDTLREKIVKIAGH
ncbi:MAG TPA: VanW family protein [Pyrinomonadaceae bacterium]|nr:VanW family protein [Pyrinomonadaceae bacterium]